MELVSQSEAKARGLTRYFTGKPCRHGHLAERMLSDRRCTDCHRAEVRAKYSANPLADNKRNRAWREANRDRDRDQKITWVQENREKVRASVSARKAHKLRATPPWADLEAIGLVYAEAEGLTLETGVLHHVDHIVPLRSKLVCGLHIAANLQPLPASDNLAKGNRHWPGMW